MNTISNNIPGAAPAAVAPQGEEWRRPTTYLQRFGDAIALLCQGRRPDDQVLTSWLDGTSDVLQQFAVDNGPAWAQGIGLIDAATIAADQPTEGVAHEMRADRTPALEAPAAPESAPWCPDVCPITGRPFFMWIDHWQTGKPVPTYGGPYDSYTIPVKDSDGSFECERYDHDEGGWLTEGAGWHCLGVRLVDDQSFVVDPSNPRYHEIEAFAAAAPQAQASAPDWWRGRADEIEVQVAATGNSEAMRCYTDMRTLLQAAAAPQAPAQEAPAAPVRQVLTDAQITHLQETRVGEPSPSRPIDASDWMNFARAIEAASLAALAKCDPAWQQGQRELLQYVARRACDSALPVDVVRATHAAMPDELAARLRKAAATLAVRHSSYSNISIAWPDEKLLKSAEGRYHQALADLDALISAIPTETKQTADRDQLDSLARKKLGALLNAFGEAQWQAGRGVPCPSIEDAFEAVISAAVALLAAAPQAPAAPVGAGYMQEPGSSNCMQCSMAFMLGLRIDQVPDFAASGSPQQCWELFESFAASQGYSAVMIPGNRSFEADYLVSGTSPRGVPHMVVMNDGRLVHDPHPSNAGLSDVQCVWLLARKAAAPQAPAAQVIENLLQLARIVNTAVEDWGETKEDDSLEVIFHKEEADKLEEILEFFDSLPDAPESEGVILSGPSRAARVLRAQAAPAAPVVDAGGQVLGEWPRVSGVGRDAESPRTLLLYLQTEASDDELRAIHDALLDGGALATHALSELMHIGYRVEGGKLVPPENLSVRASEFFGVTAVAAKATAVHSDDVAVDRFAVEMKAKLAAARAKGRGGWETCPPEVLSRMLREHADKGDPRDVANFCMFLWSLGQPISVAAPAAPAVDVETIEDAARFRAIVDAALTDDEAFDLALRQYPELGDDATIDDVRAMFDAARAAVAAQAKEGGDA